MLLSLEQNTQFNLQNNRTKMPLILGGNPYWQLAIVINSRCTMLPQVDTGTSSQAEQYALAVAPEIREFLKPQNPREIRDSLRGGITAASAEQYLPGPKWMGISRNRQIVCIMVAMMIQT